METIMEIVKDAESSIEQSKQWITQVLEKHVPLLLAFGQRLASSETGKALQEIGDLVLPPEFDAAIAAMIRFAGKAALVTTATTSPLAPEPPAAAG